MGASVSRGRGTGTTLVEGAALVGTRAGYWDHTS